MYLTVTASFCSELWASEYRPLLRLHPSTSHGWMGGWSGGGDCHCPYSDSSGHSSCHYSLQAANKASNTTGRCAWLQFHAGPTYIGIYAVLCTFIHVGAHMYDTVYSAPNELRPSEGVHVERTAHGELSTEAGYETIPRSEHDHKPGVTLKLHVCVPCIVCMQ